MRWRWIVYLLPGLAALVLWQFGGGLELDIGVAADQTVVDGFYARETSDFDGSTFRWSSPEASIGFAAPRFPAVARLRGNIPADGTRTTLDLGGGAALAMPATTQPTATRIYHLYWPDTLGPAGRAELRIRAQVPGQTLEARPLGLMVDSLRVASVAPAATLPPALVLAFFLALPGTVGWGLRRMGVRALLALAGGLLAGAGLVWFWQRHPLWVQPFVPTLALMLVFVVCAGWIPLYTVYRYGFNSWPHWLPIVAAGLALAVPFAPARLRPWLAGAAGLAVLGYGLYNYA
ncbi:MAG TPA: hypothetical protein VD886_21405, partial [Herpetosiphonaceae bacterium]|nr:hypothetical protein [Herpetosiphonaceae bacterium]